MTRRFLLNIIVAIVLAVVAFFFLPATSIREIPGVDCGPDQFDVSCVETRAATPKKQSRPLLLVLTNSDESLARDTDDELVRNTLLATAFGTGVYLVGSHRARKKGRIDAN